MEDRWISAKSIAEQLGISRERVGPIIHEDLDMRKLFAKWVPKCLNADQKVTKSVLFLHDNAPAHRAFATQKKLAYLGFQCLDHPPYSPDLAPSDYHLFPGLKKTIEGRHFSSDAGFIAAAETWLDE